MQRLVCSLVLATCAGSTLGGDGIAFHDSEGVFTSLEGVDGVAVSFEEAYWDPFEFVDGPAIHEFAGFTFTCLDATPFPPNLFISQPEQANFGVPPETRVLTVSGNEDVRIEPPGGTFAIGFDFYSNALPTLVFVRLVDGTEQTYVVSQAPDSVGYVGVSSGVAIEWVRWLADEGEDINTGVDDVRIGTTPLPTCAGDANGDGSVDSTDLNVLLGNFGKTTPVADFNRDGVVDSSDLNALLGSFGDACRT